jgi:hypothetical protein
VPTDPDTDLRNAQNLLQQGQLDEAVRTLVQLADDFWLEELYPQAEAVYRKVLEAERNHDHTLWQLADIAARQGRVVDAKQYLLHLVDVRTLRGDNEGLADCQARLQALETGPDTAHRAAATGVVEIDLNDALSDLSDDQ